MRRPVSIGTAALPNTRGLLDVYRVLHCIGIAELWAGLVGVLPVSAAGDVEPAAAGFRVCIATEAVGEAVVAILAAWGVADWC